jgi:glucosamine-6-phosphate deaminase
VRIVVYRTVAEATLAAAELVGTALVERPTLRLGLATGTTMVHVYRALRERAAERRHRMTFHEATIFGLDEYRGIGASHPGSGRRFLEQHLLGVVDVDIRRVHSLDGLCDDPTLECARYERAIEAAGGVDLQILGIGVNGHIGFNEPGSDFDSRTRLVRLSEITRRQNAGAWDGNPGNVPAEALTMGIGTICAARACLLLAFGEAKAAAVAAAVDGPLTRDVPASALQRHPDVTFVLDGLAAARLARGGRG